MSQNNENFDSIKWNSERHDKVLKERDLQEKVKKEQEAFATCGSIVNKWGKKIRRKPITHAQLFQRFNELHTDMACDLNKCSKEGKAFVLQMMEDAKALMIATNCGQVAIIKQHLPGDTESIPRTIQFRNQAELEAIPFVKRFSEQEGFVGFSANKMGLAAIYESKNGISDTPLVGMIWCPKHITLKYPELAAFKAEIEKEK